MTVGEGGTNQAIEIHELPPLDLVLLSHFHGDHFDQVAERELDKFLPIVTTPVEMLHIVNPKQAIPIHYNDYDVFKSPLADFQEAVAGAGLKNWVHYLRHGETYTFMPGK